MLRRRRELKHTTGAKAEKRHIFSNAKEKLKAFFHLERPLTAEIRDARCSPGAVEPYCGGQFGTPTRECIILDGDTKLTVHIQPATPSVLLPFTDLPVVLPTIHLPFLSMPFHRK